VVIAQSESQRRELWRLREIHAGGHQWQEGGLIKHDIAVPVSQSPRMIERGTRAAQAACPGVRVIAFGHMGDGNIHFNVSQPVDADKAAFLARWDEMNAVVHAVVLRYGGSIAAEHGVGRLKRALLAETRDAVDLDLMRRLKTAFDPAGILSPGRVL
jgi:FAD/FMN-containing dehydrogenase